MTNITTGSFTVDPSYFNNWFKKAASPPQDMPSPMKDLTPVYKSRIKMIAVGMEFVPRTVQQTGDIVEVVQSVPYVLMHDDRVFQYDSENEDWTELPPLPE